MKIVKGKFAEAKIFTDIVEETALEQVKSMVDHEMTEGSQVRLMSDIHAGKGSTIGTTIKLPADFADWKVSPNVVGSDVGCAVLMYKLGDKNIDLSHLDEMITKVIPAGQRVHDRIKDKSFSKSLIEDLTFEIKNKRRIYQSLGTLGGGNHFVELGKDEEGNFWLSVHSGSRGLGLQVAKHHQNVAIKRLEESQEGQVDIGKLIRDLKEQGRHSEISAMLEKVKSERKPLNDANKTLATLKGEDLKAYLADMMLAQAYASKSRETMLNLIVKRMEFTVVDSFDSVHNFIEHDNFENGTIRKGATSAKKGERLVIPLNMLDGSIIAVGKGNADWNNSAPHGAGRLMSRTRAKAELNLDDFKKEMENIVSSSINESTLDEAPGAYKPAKEILKYITPTVDVLHVVKPVYNFKASE